MRESEERRFKDTDDKHKDFMKEFQSFGDRVVK